MKHKNRLMRNSKGMVYILIPVVVVILLLLWLYGLSHGTFEGSFIKFGNIKILAISAVLIMGSIGIIIGFGLWSLVGSIIGFIVALFLSVLILSFVLGGGF